MTAKVEAGGTNSFEFAQKLVRAKDIQEVMALQQEYLQSQMKAMSEQAKDLGKAADYYTAAYNSYPDHDGLARGQCLAQLGAVSLELLRDSQENGATALYQGHRVLFEWQS